MRYIYIIFYIIFLSNYAYSNILFETDEYELKFYSDNINQLKEKKINLIKVKSFQKILKKLLTNENYNKINIDDLEFINQFILNYKINNEKIINNYYYSNIKINFNKDLIFDYLNSNNIQYVVENPDKFFLIILESNDLKNYLFSKDNSFYKFLITNKNNYYREYFIIPNLDHNDRFLFNKNHFENNIFEQNELLNLKYKTKYQIMINSYKENNLIINNLYLYYNDKKYLIDKISSNNLNYQNFFDLVLSKSLNKWKQINQIDPSIVNSLECSININNIHELKYVRNLLTSNILVKDIKLHSIELNKNIYKIKFFDKIEIFKNLLKKNRLLLMNENNSCNIKLI